MTSCIKLVLLYISTVYADYTDSYGAPYAPSYDSYSAPAAPVQSYQALPANNVDHKHVHHHFYHPSQPIVKVPVTQRPFVVKVPQNVPVKFVPVNVPTQAPQYQHLPVQYAPQYGYHLQGQDEGFVKRKELIKSALLLGAGVVKGAVITTLINQAQNGK